MVKLEGMAEFFEKRIEGYDDHMLNEVAGCREGYVEMARRVPEDCRRLLDLGCGTGLELSEIFKLFPSLSVTAVDLSRLMLARLTEKFPDRDIATVCANYLTLPLGDGEYDCVVSFQTMHHFEREEKIKLYEKIRRAIRNGGVYIECDYMAASNEESESLRERARELRRQQEISDEALCHFDIPYTVDAQREMLVLAGFKSAEAVFNMENTTMLVCKI